MYYFFIIAIQVVCIWHWLKYGRERWWIWLIIFLPLVGGLIYLFSNIITKDKVENAQQNVVSIINPTKKIKDLEKKLQFSDTFENKVALADAYQEEGFFEQSVGLYESALIGVFSDNQHVIRQLIIAYDKLESYEKLCDIVDERVTSKGVLQIQHHFLYARALERLDRIEQANEAFKKIAVRYSDLENRVYYGRFLIKHSKTVEATEVFEEILEEVNHMDKKEKRQNQEWIEATRSELKSL